MRLLSVELRRFASRRANILVAAVGLLFLVGSLTILGASSHKPSEAELATADKEAADIRAELEDRQQECDESGEGDLEYTGGRSCEDMFNPSQVQASDYLSGVVSFADEAKTQITFLGVVFVVCALLMSGSFVGAEWTSGGMTNLLQWKPRRLPVYTAKLATAMIAVLGLTIAATVLHMGGLYIIAATNGDVGTLDATWWQYHGEFTLRLLAVIAVAVCWGVSLSMIGRRTVVAIGSVLAYIVVFELGLRQLIVSVDAFNPQYWLLSTYVRAWIDGSVHVYQVSTHSLEDADFIFMWQGGGVLLAVTAALLAGSALVFSRRDTT